MVFLWDRREGLQNGTQAILFCGCIAEAIGQRCQRLVKQQHSSAIPRCELVVFFGTIQVPDRATVPQLCGHSHIEHPALGEGNVSQDDVSWLGDLLEVFPWSMVFWVHSLQGSCDSLYDTGRELDCSLGLSSILVAGKALELIDELLAEGTVPMRKDYLHGERDELHDGNPAGDGYVWAAGKRVRERVVAWWAETTHSRGCRAHPTVFTACLQRHCEVPSIGLLVCGR
mmetsp:Transcript_24107/g.67021  ORF Transcript_24107/g.67021 Transcript_24107/m.67021 type:complete len:228 (+) Transcript_24107:3299-3982(+)